MRRDHSPIRWTQTYCVNVAALDEQHRRLFQAVNDLNLALRAGIGNAALEAVLKNLVDYAAFHFQSEEALMEQHAFPGLSMHRAQHEMFRDKVGAFLDDYRAGRSGVAVSLMLFLQAWLNRHLLKTDKLYSAFLNARGVY